jgi:hypothetical protein
MKCIKCGNEVFYLARGTGRPGFACVVCGYLHDLDGPAPAAECADPSGAAIVPSVPQARRQRSSRSGPWRAIRSRQA